MKKGLLILMSVLCLVFAFSGCNLQGGDVKSHKAFTFFVDSGDHVQVELDTTGGYDITSEMPFVISKDGSTQSQGMFIKAEYFESYKEVVNTDANAKVIETKTKDSNEYVF